MKKHFTLALVGLLGLGAAAVALPAALSNTAPATTLADEATTTKIKANGVDGQRFSASWNPLTNGFDLTFNLPTTGKAMDEEGEYTIDVDLPYITKAVVLTDGESYSDPKVELKVFENPTPGEVLKWTHVVPEKGKTYYYYMNIYVDDVVDSKYPSMLYAGEAKTLPGEPTDVSYITTQGQAPVTIKFKAPATYAGSDIAIDKIDKITLYTSEYDYDLWTTVTKEWGVLTDVEPGSQQQFIIEEALEPKTYNFKLKATAYDGDSEDVNVSVLIGKDRPDTPKNVKVTEQADGNLLITWDPVTTGVQGGYFVPEEVTYTVSRSLSEYASPETLAENLTVCSYTFDASTLTSPTELRFFVCAATPEGTSSNGAAPVIIAGPASSIPFVETFNNNGNPDNLWTSYCPKSEYLRVGLRDNVYLGSTQYKPVGDNGYMAMVSYYSSYAGYATYYTSAKIDVTGYTSLDLAFSLLRVPGTSGVVNAQIAFDGGEFATVATGDMNDGTTVEWKKHKGTVEVPAGAKTAVVRFEFLAGDKPDYICIDEVSLRETGAAAIVYPASATDINAVYDFEANEMKVTCTAPRKSHATLGDVNDQPLDAITCIKLYRQIGYDDYTLVHTWGNPTPGDDLEWIDKDLDTGGEYRYKAITYVGENCDFGAFMDTPVMVGQVPADVTDVKAITDKGKAPVTISFKAPTLDSQEAPLRAISKIDVFRRTSSEYSFSDTPVKTFQEEEITLGEELKYIDTDVEENYYYYYKVVAYGSAGASIGAQVSVFVGIDTPDKPGNVVAKVNEDKSVTITWTAPTQGTHGGYVDPEALTYTVLVGAPNSEYEYYATELDKDITGTSYTYTPDVDDEQSMRYFVKAVNGTNAGESALSNTIFVGNPAALPYIENFNTKINDWSWTYNHLWTATAEGSNDNFGCAEQAYMPGDIGQVSPVDADGALVYVYYGTYSTEVYDQYLTSGNINVADAELAVVSFYYYAVAGYDTEIGLDISFDGGEFYNFFEESFRDHEGEDGWQKVELPVDVRMMNASTIQLRFHAHKGVYSCSAVIDNVKVFNLPAPKLEANGGTLSWTVEPNEFVELKNFMVYKKTDEGAERVQTLDATATSFDVTEEGTYFVSAIYGETLETGYSNEVDVVLQGVNSALAGNVTVKAEAGNIVVEGAEGLAVSICTVDGRVLYSAVGDATVAVVPGIYIVRAGGSAVKLDVR